MISSDYDLTWSIHTAAQGYNQRKEVHGLHGLLNRKDAKKNYFMSSRPGKGSLFGRGIYAVVETADASNCIDACGMTIKFC